MNTINAFGLQSLYGSGLSQFGAQQANLLNRLDIRQAGAMSQEKMVAQMLGMLNIMPMTPLSRAQKIAKEVRERNPSMQVQRRTRRGV